MSSTVEWKKSEHEDRWTPYVDGVQTLGMDVTMNRDGAFVSFDADLWFHLESAQNHVETSLLLRRADRPTVSLVLTDRGEVVHVASTTQRAAEWALNNGFVHAPIVEWTVDQ